MSPEIWGFIQVSRYFGHTSPHMPSLPGDNFRCVIIYLFPSFVADDNIYRNLTFAVVIAVVNVIDPPEMLTASPPYRPTLVAALSAKDEALRLLPTPMADICPAALSCTAIGSYGTIPSRGRWGRGHPVAL